MINFVEDITLSMSIAVNLNWLQNVRLSTHQLTGWQNIEQRFHLFVVVQKFLPSLQ